MTSQVIDRMAVEVDGPGGASQGDAILCIHGLGATSNFYTPLCLALASRYRVVRPDLPGSGRSPARDGLTSTPRKAVAPMCTVLDARPDSI